MSSVRRGGSFGALAEMVKAQAGILEGDPPDEAEAKLAQTTADVLSGTPGADWVQRHLGALAGLGGGGVLAGSDRNEVFAAWRHFFETLAERRPLVLVFEDLHWAYDGLLDFVDYLAGWAGEVPLLVVATARPELLARRPGWGGGKPNALTLSLTPLSDVDTARLIGLLLGHPVLDPGQQAALLAQAGGNPLFAEQYVQMLAGQGAGRHLPLPESVQGIIDAQARWRATRAKLLARSGQFPAAQTLLDEAAALVSPTSWAVLQAEILMARAEVNRLAGEPEHAQASLRAALRIYQDRHATTLADQAAAALANLTGHPSAKPA